MSPLLLSSEELITATQIRSGQEQLRSGQRERERDIETIYRSRTFTDGDAVKVGGREEAVALRV
jgi:hypothetical protein